MCFVAWGGRNLTMSPLLFGPEGATVRQALRKHYASAKLKLTSIVDEVT